MMNPCEPIRDLLAPYEEGQLTQDETVYVATHLKNCAACRKEATAQSLMRTRLRRYREIMEPASPPVALLKRARVVWEHSDKTKSRRAKWRFAMAGSALTTLFGGVAWARFHAPGEFPIAFALQNFAQSKTTPPTFLTRDPDLAANWLRGRLNREIPAINLHLSRARLLGADLLKTSSGSLGKLTYLAPQGRITLYFSPEKTEFAGTRDLERLDRHFAVRDERKIGRFLGWAEGKMGYGLVTSSFTLEGVVLNAKRSTETR